MRILITLFSFLALTSCVAQKEVESNSSLKVSYEARTRGFSKIIQIVDNSVACSENTNKKTLKLSSDEKKKLLKLINEISIEEMHNFKPPTKERLFDGAPHAIVKINKNGKEYQSCNFDDGNPPKELEELVNALLMFLE